MAAKRQRVSTRSGDRVSVRVFADETTMRQPGLCVSVQIVLHADLIKKGPVAKCERPKQLIQ